MANNISSKDRKVNTEPSALASSEKDADQASQDYLITDQPNPFLMTKSEFDPALVMKTGYRMRSDYMKILSYLKQMKKGYTIEALLDDALTSYLKTSPEADAAIQMFVIGKQN